MRPLSIALALCTLAALPACKKKEDTGGTYFPPITTSDSGRDTYVPPPKIYRQLRLIGFLVWDAAAGEIVPYTYQGGSRTSRLEVRLYETDIDSDFCIVAIELAGYTASATAKDEGYAWGVDVPAGDKPWYETCTDDGFDVDQFIGPLIEDLAAWDWHLRLYADLDPGLVEWLTPDPTPPDFDIDEYTGGNFWTDDGSISTDASSNYWYGYEVDPNFDVDPDTAAPKLHSSTMVDANGDLTTGYYVFDQNVVWNYEE